MSQDILFKTEDFIFSYRVGGILIHDDKILLQKPKDDDYAIIGGHVAFKETAKEALIREYYEEIHAKIEVDDLMAVSEIFFSWGNKTCHQVCFYYKIHLAENPSIPLEGSFQGYDEYDQLRIDLDFYWVPLDELRKGLKVYPMELIPHLLEDKHEIIHFVSKEK